LENENSQLFVPLEKKRHCGSSLAPLNATHVESQNPKDADLLSASMPAIVNVAVPCPTEMRPLLAESAQWIAHSTEKIMKTLKNR
jgi:hypothetical protein